MLTNSPRHLVRTYRFTFSRGPSVEGFKNWYRSWEGYRRATFDDRSSIISSVHASWHCLKNLKVESCWGGGGRGREVARGRLAHGGKRSQGWEAGGGGGVENSGEGGGGGGGRGQCGGFDGRLVAQWPGPVPSAVPPSAFLANAQLHHLDSTPPLLRPNPY